MTNIFSSLRMMKYLYIYLQLDLLTKLTRKFSSLKERLWTENMNFSYKTSFRARVPAFGHIMDHNLSQSERSRTIVDGLLSQSGRPWAKVDGHTTKSGRPFG